MGIFNADGVSQVALVTGAGQGVGRGIAMALAAEGATVVLATRTVAKAHDVKAEITDLGGQALALELNVKDPAALQQCVDTVSETYGRLDFLINNAQEVPLGALLEVTDQAYADGMTSGPQATFRLMRACYPLLAKQGGSIVNLATGAAIRSNARNFGAYTAAKEAIRALTRAAATEWGEVGIRVNAILPLAETPAMVMWREMDAAGYKETMSEVPLGRMGDCEHDIGRVVVFLCGPDSSYISGHSIPIDGGMVHMR